MHLLGNYDTRDIKYYKLKYFLYSSGKTVWLYNLLKEKDLLIEPKVHKTILFYVENQPIYQKMLEQNLIQKAINNIPEYEKIRDIAKEHNKEGHILLLFDDAKGYFHNLEPLYLVGSHHLKASSIMLTQNLFAEGPSLRSISLNAHYVVLFKSLRGEQQIRTFARQISTTQSSFIVKSYKSSTKQPYSYLIIDLKPSQSDVVRLRSRIFSHEGIPICFHKNSF